MLLQEFDPEKRAVIDPSDIIRKRVDMPEIVLTCFTKETMDRLIEQNEGEVFASLGTTSTKRRLYRIRYHGRTFGAYLSDAGAAIASLILENVYQMGAETVIAYGSCGVLDRTIEDGCVIIPTSAFRDEGTSYHYQPPSDEIPVNPKYQEEFQRILTREGASWRTGKVWTTDAFYRETPEKTKRRKDAGCIAVDMECSALTAVARFRGRDLFQFFHAADNLDAEAWDRRSLDKFDRRHKKDLFSYYALELARELSGGSDG